MGSAEWNRCIDSTKPTSHPSGQNLPTFFWSLPLVGWTLPQRRCHTKGRHPEQKLFTFGHCPYHWLSARLDPPPLPNSGNFVLFFWTSNTTFCAFYGKKYQWWQWWLNDNLLISGISTWWKVSQNFRAGPPPWLGQCPKVNILFYGRSSLRLKHSPLRDFWLGLSKRMRMLGKSTHL